MSLLASLLLLIAADTPSEPPKSDALAGNWTVDLRPSDDAAKYTQPMVLMIAADGKVAGEFYNSTISDGRYGTARGRQCVAFRTSDGLGPYEHSACLVDGKMVGQSWAEHRGFLLPWTASRSIAPAAQ